MYAIDILVCVTYSSSICSISRHYKYCQEEVSLAAHFFSDLFPYIWTSETITGVQGMEKITSGRLVLVPSWNQLLVTPSDWCNNDSNQFLLFGEFDQQTIYFKRDSLQRSFANCFFPLPLSETNVNIMLKSRTQYSTPEK